MPEAKARGIGKFLLAVFVGLVIVMGIVVLWIYFHGHKPGLMRSSSSVLMRSC
jgi:hypothetical protein